MKNSNTLFKYFTVEKTKIDTREPLQENPPSTFQEKFQKSPDRIVEEHPKQSPKKSPEQPPQKSNQRPSKKSSQKPQKPSIKMPLTPEKHIEEKFFEETQAKEKNLKRLKKQNKIDPELLEQMHMKQEQRNIQKTQTMIEEDLNQEDDFIKFTYIDDKKAIQKDNQKQITKMISERSQVVKKSEKPQVQKTEKKIYINNADDYFSGNFEQKTNKNGLPNNAQVQFQDSEKNQDSIIQKKQPGDFQEHSNPIEQSPIEKEHLSEKTISLKSDQKTIELKDQENIEIIKELKISSQSRSHKKSLSPKKSNQISRDQATEKNPQNCLLNQKFVITGVLNEISRDQFNEVVKVLGGKVTGQVSKVTNFLVAGEKLEDGRATSTSTKYQKATQSKNCQILNEKQFQDLIKQKSGKSIQQILNQDFDGTQTQNQKQAPSNKKTSLIQQSHQSLQKEPQQKIFASNDKKYKKFQQLWTQKYAPKSTREIIGNQQQIQQILNWLKDWEEVVRKENHKTSVFSHGSKSQLNLNARACLISGPPGIGKTTTVRLLGQDLGYHIIEQNASDIRNKNNINSMLNPFINDKKQSEFNSSKDNASVQIQSLLNLQKIRNSDDMQFIANNQKYFIFMDEVDGMSSGDRGGNQALIDVIKNTKVPIICVCNDRQNPKIRSLANSCLDIKFSRPTKVQVTNRLQQIGEQENILIEKNALELLCESLGNDLRQILNFLQSWKRKIESQVSSSSDLKYLDVKKQLFQFKKDDSVMISNFDSARQLLSKQELQKLNFRKRMELFFLDYELIPLLIQENYLNCLAERHRFQKVNFQNQDRELELMANAADSISNGDIISKSIRTNNEWGLLSDLGFSSSIYPCQLVQGICSFPYPKFPEWLGKNSSFRKKKREIKEMSQILSKTITSNKNAIKFDVSSILFKQICHLLALEEVDSAIKLLENYDLQPQIVTEQLKDIQFNKQADEMIKKIPAAIKTKLTKQYNQKHPPFQKQKKREKQQDMTELQQIKNENEFLDEIVEEDSQNEEEDLKLPTSKGKPAKQKQQSKGKQSKSKKK